MAYDFSINRIEDIWFNDNLKKNMFKHLENREHTILIGGIGFGKTTIQDYFTSFYKTFKITTNGNTAMDTLLQTAMQFVQTNINSMVKCVAIDGLMTIIEKGSYDNLKKLLIYANHHRVPVVITCSDKKRNHKKVIEIIKTFKIHTYYLDALRTKESRYWRTLQILGYDVSRSMKTRIWHQSTYDIRSIVNNIAYQKSVGNDELFDTTMFDVTQHFFNKKTTLNTIMNSQRTDTHNVSLIAHWNIPNAIRKLKRPHTQRQALDRTIRMIQSIATLDLMDYIISSSNQWQYQFLCNGLKIQMISQIMHNLRNKNKKRLNSDDLEFTRLITYWSKRLSKNKLEYVEEMCNSLGVSSSYSIEVVYALSDNDIALQRLTRELDNI